MLTHNMQNRLIQSAKHWLTVFVLVLLMLAGNNPSQQQQLTTAGQWCKASELLTADWQQQQQKAGQIDPDTLQQQIHRQQLSQQQQPQQPQSTSDGLYYMEPPVSSDTNIVDDPNSRSSWQASDVKEQQRQQSGSNKGIWTCLVCTYSSNKAILLRCEMCDTPKGDKHASSFSLHQTSSSSRSVQQQHHRKAARGRPRAASSLSGKQGRGKQLKLDSVVLSGAANQGPS